jgi:hypothetical protein
VWLHGDPSAAFSLRQMQSITRNAAPSSMIARTLS